MAKGSIYTSTRVDGLSAVTRALVDLGVRVDDLKGAMAEVAADGARVARSFAPRRTGRLAGDVRGNRAKAKAVIAVGRVSVPYAGPINYGWAAHNIAPNGFMQRADKAIQPFALRRIERNINELIQNRGLS